MHAHQIKKLIAFTGSPYTLSIKVSIHSFIHILDIVWNKDPSQYINIQVGPVVAIKLHCPRNIFHITDIDKYCHKITLSHQPDTGCYIPCYM